MRIAYITYEYPPDTPDGGIATYVHQVARMMQQRGHGVEVFTASSSRNGTQVVDNILEHRVQETDRGIFRKRVGEIFALRHKDNPFDVLEGPDYYADADHAIQLVPDIPFVVKVHTPSFLVNGLTGAVDLRRRLRYELWKLLATGSIVPNSISIFLLNKLRRGEESLNSLYRLEREHALKADIVAPPCEDMCSIVENYWQISKSKIRFSPHPYLTTGTNDPLFDEHGKKIVGFVGRLQRLKGIDVLVRAIPRVVRVFPDVKFRFIGNPLNHSSGQRYDNWIKNFLGKYKDCAEFFGKVGLEQIPLELSKMAVCVFPSLWDNFPNVCLEAMSVGRPIIASSSGGMREMLNGGEVGRLVPPGDSRALARSIIELLGNRQECQRLGALAKIRLRSKYSWEFIGPSMESMYCDAISRARQRRR